MDIQFLLFCAWIDWKENPSFVLIQRGWLKHNRRGFVPTTQVNTATAYFYQDDMPRGISWTMSPQNFGSFELKQLSVSLPSQNKSID